MVGNPQGYWIDFSAMAASANLLLSPVARPFDDTRPVEEGTRTRLRLYARQTANPLAAEEGQGIPLKILKQPGMALIDTESAEGEGTSY